MTADEEQVLTSAKIAGHRNFAPKSIEINTARIRYLSFVISYFKEDLL